MARVFQWCLFVSAFALVAPIAVYAQDCDPEVDEDCASTWSVDTPTEGQSMPFDQAFDAKGYKLKGAAQCKVVLQKPKEGGGWQDVQEADTAPGSNQRVWMVTFSPPDPPGNWPAGNYRVIIRDGLGTQKAFGGTFELYDPNGGSGGG